MVGRKLGRGLDILISNEAVPAATEVLQLPLSRIHANPSQPRKRFALEELEGLKASVAREGFLQPVVVRKAGGDGYQLVVGERRFRAAQELGLDTIPALVVSVGDDRMLELALVENVQRENLNPIELATAYRQLMQEKGWTQEALAESLGLSRPAVANTLRLLDLPEDMRVAVSRGQITMGHAKVLLSVSDPKEQRLLFERIAEEKLTVRDLEEERAPEPRRDGPGGPPPRKPPRRPDSAEVAPHIQSLAEQFSDRLGTRVRIRERRGRGKLIVEFYSPEDFERIREIILGRGGP